MIFRTLTRWLLNNGFIAVVLLILLKLMGEIDWSWWWVLSPLWIGAIVGVIAFIAVAIAVAGKHGS